ncbi:OmpA family protein [Nesterenkonia sp. HG001]|uniref:OmpA family protein n=1 Tax=Nesterenkonia sp. HG001 TaxID=2983207 RepID=UPI002AC51798|nr:OmpA family protein [Nesterenkonia sp. HG001]MDZ5076922.1 OmpA family protein [Nesterenkonia sp. HG001]
MIQRRPRSRAEAAVAALAAAGVLVLLGCAPEAPPAAPEEPQESDPSEETPGTEPDPEPEPEEDPGEDPEGTDAVVVDQTVWNFDTMEEVDLRVEVHPFVRVSTKEGDFLNGLITYQITSDSGEYHLDRHGVHPHEVRLVDTEAQRITHPAFATDGSGEEHLADVEDSTVHAGDGPVRWAGVHADPGTESTAVLLPYLGLIEDVAIVDAEDADTSDYLPAEEALPELVEIHEATWDLQSHRERADGDVQIRQSDDGATLTLDSDILFAVDEHTLTEEAEAALQVASDELEGFEGGELRIIGHTDDVRSLEHNEQLSADRAEAVHQRLEELLDAEDLTVTAEGRAFHEPVASNETEQGRAMNRRVELHYTPAEVSDPPDTEDAGGLEQTEDDDLPSTSGPVGEAGEPLEITGEHGGVVEVNVEGVYTAGNLLVGRIRVEVLETADDGEEPLPLSWALGFGDLGMHESHENPYNPGNQTDALTLLNSQERIFPLEFGGTESFEGADEDGFILEQGDPWRSVAADRGFGTDAEAEVGSWSMATVLWPQTGTEEVVVDVPGQSEHAERPWSEPWRVVDVPVETEKP